MKELAPVLMVQGTSSDVGKSLVVTALCRWFANRGLRVAPFKAQNMALNSSVTRSGAEIGCAQYFQAEAAKTVASPDMNPILLKPEGERQSQVIVLGTSLGSHGFRDYHERKPELRKIIAKSLLRLREEHDLVIVEGAGSPAEINLKAHDLVNMFVAREANAPVLLVGDIDKGGVFAALVGTLALLEPEECELVAGFIINKFRGDPSLLQSGIDMLEARTQKKVYGLLPYMNKHGIADEDSLALDTRPARLRHSPDGIDIGIVRWPRMSNYDEFNALERETQTSVAFVTSPQDILAADLLILPGSKSTLSDLQWCRDQGLANAISDRIRQAKPTMAICGGYQMLGQKIVDPEGYEASEACEIMGLGLVPRWTRFEAQKITRQVRAFWNNSLPWCDSETELHGYEIHMGRVINDLPNDPTMPFALKGYDESGNSLSAGLEKEGYWCPERNLFGTLVHGLFENTVFRLGMLNMLRERKRLARLITSEVPPRDLAFDRAAAHIDQHCDMKAIVRLLKLEERLGL